MSGIHNLYKHWLIFKSSKYDNSQYCFPKDVKSIWISRLELLGDILLTTPFPQLLKKKWPNAKLTVIVEERFEAVWKYNNYVDEIIGIGNISKQPDYFHFERIAKKARLEGVDLFLSLDFKYPGALLARLCHPRWSLGFEHEYLGNNIWNETIPRRNCSCKDLYKDFATKLNLDINKWKQEINWSLNDDLKAEILLVKSKKKLIGLAPWTSNEIKNWHLNEVIKFCELAYQYQYQVVVLGVQADLEKSKLLMERTLSKPLNLVGKTSITELAAVVNHLDIIVSTDTGIAHLGATLDKFLIVLYGISDPNFWAPDSKNLFIFKNPTCEGCNPLYPPQNTNECLKGNYNCMSFDPNLVFQTLEKILNSNGVNSKET